MEAEWLDADVVTLIAFYEKNTCLYDVMDSNYKNRDIKRLKEIELAGVLNKTGENRSAAVVDSCIAY